MNKRALLDQFDLLAAQGHFFGDLYTVGSHAFGVALRVLVLGFNGALIALGAIGILPPATSALLHNTSTLGVTMHSMTNLLPKA